MTTPNIIFGWPHLTSYQKKLLGEKMSRPLCWLWDGEKYIKCFPFRHQRLGKRCRIHRMQGISADEYNFRPQILWWFHFRKKQVDETHHFKPPLSQWCCNHPAIRDNFCKPFFRDWWLVLQKGGPQDKEHWFASPHTEWDTPGGSHGNHLWPFETNTSRKLSWHTWA